MPQSQIVSGGPGKDGIPALTNPTVVSAEAVDAFLLPDDLVLGLVENGEARAYPHAVLWWHEIINDVLGGRPILVTFCPLTGSGIAQDPVIDGQLHNFGVSGLLFDNNLIMFDRTTDSLWSQMRLQSICGSFTGAAPPLLPIVQTTWSAWKAMHPSTTAVSFDTGFSRNYDVYPYGDYDRVDNPTLLFPQPTPDPRLPPKENVLGVRHGGGSHVYSMTRMSSVASRMLVHDDVDGLAVLVAFDAAARLAIPFDRTLVLQSPAEDGSGGATERLDFEIVDPDVFPFTLRDVQTGSVWNLDGVATDGPHVGRRLRKLPTYTAFWFAWSAFNANVVVHDPRIGSSAAP